MEFKEYSVVQVRIARPTDKFSQVIDFYEIGLGLKRLTDFGGPGHAGYNGVIYGLPEAPYHLEFTEHVDGTPCPAPTKDNLLVFYIPSREEIDKLKDRLEGMGYPEVEPENPYWKNRGVTIEDPDGWRVVLMNTNGI
ncbi:VOC family protein [Ornithinibacillus xuwenensis]|uniref:VOC family protein n=1 Tax=Ornithinibacillus xuwenensis TaxID=3144668 RepID=A0ABU9XHT7_9BACI